MGGDLGEARRGEEGLILGERAFAAFGAGEHVQRLQQSWARAGVIVVEEGFGDEEAAVSGQGGVDFSEEEFDLWSGPIVQNATEGVEVSGGQRVGEEVTGEALDVRDRISFDNRG